MSEFLSELRDLIVEHPYAAVITLTLFEIGHGLGHGIFQALFHG